MEDMWLVGLPSVTQNMSERIGVSVHTLRLVFQVREGSVLGVIALCQLKCE
jgi:hypothetical protein